MHILIFRKDIIMDWNAILSTFVNGCITVAWRLVLSLFIFIIGRLFIKFILKKLKKNKKFNEKLDSTVSNFICNVVKFGLYLLLVLCIIGTLGIEMASIITVLATAGAAVALAVQGAFSNLVGGMMIIIFKPIRVNDYVEIGGKSGIVEDLGIFYTTLKTGDNLTITVPNSTIVDSVTVNYTRKDTRRLDLALAVAYGTDIDKAKAVITDVITSHELTLDTPTPFVRMTAMKDSSIEITVRVWCNRSNFLVLKSDLLEILKKRFETEGIEIPFPQLDVHTK